jgi:hypothetical protein
MNTGGKIVIALLAISFISLVILLIKDMIDYPYGD